MRTDARYRDMRLLGSGGMATVTLAEDTKLGRLVALKRVHGTGDPRGLTRLRREALVGASLNHPNLVSVYDVLVEDDGDLTIVMQYVAGSNLREAIGGEGIRPAREALRILEELASGLDAIHARGIVHRDVKPANVLLGTDGAVKLADLGIATVAERTQITTAGAVLGTFGYMAPEQLDGRASDPAVDIYALSAVAFEVLCGRKARPEANPLALAHAISTRPPPDLRDQWRDAPPEVAALLQRGMALDPSQRPRSAGELVRRLGAGLESHNTEAMAALTPRPPPPAPLTAAAPITPASEPAAPAAAAPADISASVKPPPVKPPPIKSPLAAGSKTTASRRGPAATGRGPRRERRTGVLVVVAVAVVVGGALAAVLGGGGAGQGSGTGRKAKAAETRTTARGRSATARSRRTGASKSATGSSAAPAVSGETGQAVTGTSGVATPSDAVQSFYESAARHDYAGAWRLADANLRNQLAGYSSFQSQMSAVRSITFHQAQTLTGASGSAATVAIRTTSQLSDGTQQCAGTVRTLRSSGTAWLLDGLSVNCTS